RWAAWVWESCQGGCGAETGWRDIPRLLPYAGNTLRLVLLTVVISLLLAVPLAGGFPTTSYPAAAGCSGYRCYRWHCQPISVPTSIPICSITPARCKACCAS